jgi:hypothetical protein
VQRVRRPARSSRAGSQTNHRVWKGNWSSGGNRGRNVSGKISYI